MHLPRFAILEMVLDPLSSLSLAASILQFIEFSSKLISKTNEIRKTGTTEDVVDLEYVSTSLDEICEGIQTDNQNSALDDGLSKLDLANKHRMDDIARACQGVAKDISTALNKLAQKKCQSHKWQSFYQALQLVWKRDRIDRLGAKLNDLRSQLTLQTVTIIR